MNQIKLLKLFIAIDRSLLAQNISCFRCSRGLVSRGSREVSALASKFAFHRFVYQWRYLGNVQYLWVCNCRRVTRDNKVGQEAVAATQIAWYTQRRSYLELRQQKRCTFWTSTLVADRHNPSQLWRSVDLLEAGRRQARRSASRNSTSSSKTRWKLSVPEPSTLLK